MGVVLLLPLEDFLGWKNKQQKPNMCLISSSSQHSLYPRPILFWLNWFCPLAVPKRGLHSSTTPRACGPGLYPRQNQQDRGAWAQLLCFHLISAGIKSQNSQYQHSWGFLFLLLMCSGAERIRAKEHELFIFERLLLTGVCFHVAGPALWGSCVHGGQQGWSALTRTCEKWRWAICLPAEGIYLSVCPSIRLFLCLVDTWEEQTVFLELH